MTLTKDLLIGILLLLAAFALIVAFGPGERPVEQPAVASFLSR